MTNPRDPDALLAAYLADGMEVLPQRVVDSVLDEVHRTRQRTVLGPRRTPMMFRPALVAAALAALVATGSFLVFSGITLDPRPSARPSVPSVVVPSPTLGGPSERPTPSAVTNPGGVWITTGTMGTPRTGPAAVRLLDGRVLVVGGPSDGSELYDPLTGTWTATAGMANPGEGGATLLRDGRVLVGDVVGENPDDPTSEIHGAEIYDPQSGTWTETGKMVNGGGVATLLRDGKVLVTGNGELQTGNGSAQILDPEQGTWTAVGRMINPRNGHAAILLPDGKVLVAGGHVVTDFPTDSAELFDPATGTWTATASMHIPRETINGFLQPDGKVLVLGSTDTDPQSAELYDPANGTWSSTGDVSMPGTSQEVATLLLDGRILVTGFDNTAELYDPATGSWSAAAPMHRPHFTAVLLLDGTVLMAGGHDCLDHICVSTGSAELYVPAGVPPPPLPAFPPAPPPVFPTPTPRPSQYPRADGPVPPNARPWTVTVVNDSDQPVTLFLAEDDGSDTMNRLCGSVTPNVVPAETTMDVSFLLPAKAVRGCALLVDPVPGDLGGLFETSEVPMAGKVWITDYGQIGWLGP